MLVSKQHFRIYTIIYDTEKLDEYPPSIYCEDLESRNGTYVNNTLIGIAGNERIGHLLVEGDSIEIRPDWKFQFHQPKSRMTSHMPLPDIEIKVLMSLFSLGMYFMLANRCIVFQRSIHHFQPCSWKWYCWRGLSCQKC